MAPRKRKAAEATKETVRSPPPPSPRRTRSSSSSAPAAPPARRQQRPSKKSKPSKGGEEKPEKPAKAKPEPAAEAPVAAGSKTIIVEACKQCHQFKKRALLVKEGLENGVPGIIVKINPEKPRRGCLEIREENGRIFLSLLNMPRPFTKMRELDMDKVIADIIKDIT